MTEPKPMPSAPPPRLPRPVSHGELVHLLQYAHRTQWALNSAVECHLHTVEVVGSNPTAPTIESKSLPPSLPEFGLPKTHKSTPFPGNTIEPGEDSHLGKDELALRSDCISGIGEY